jgi:hypothetical protein
MSTLINHEREESGRKCDLFEGTTPTCLKLDSEKPPLKERKKGRRKKKGNGGREGGGVGRQRDGQRDKQIKSQRHRIGNSLIYLLIVYLTRLSAAQTT